MIRECDISRILIVGTGSMGIRHYDIAKQLFPNAEIAFFSGSGFRSQLAPTLGSRSDIELFRPEISVIANQASRHLEMAVFLSSLGSHLLIEKPVSHNLEGIHELMAFRNDKNLKIQVGYNLRYLPSFILFESLLKENTVGRVLDVRIEVGQSLESWRPGRDYQSTASARKINGGGVLRELSHEFDYLLALFGFPLWVLASLGKVSDLEIDVEDIAHVIAGMKHESGTEFMATLSLDFIRRDKKRICTVIGTNGTLEWNLLNGEIKEKTTESSEQIVIHSTKEEVSNSYFAEWIDFVDAIRLDAEPSNSVEDSINNMRVILACEKSHNEASKILLNTNPGGVNE